MKKIISFLAILCLVSVLFCGCGKKNNDTGSDVAGTSGEAVSDENAVDGDSSNTSSTALGSGTGSLSADTSMTQGVEIVDTNDIADVDQPINVGTVSGASSSSSKNSASSSKPNGSTGSSSSASSSSSKASNLA